MKNGIQYKKEPKIEICYYGIITIRLITCDESDYANSMGMIRPSKGI